MKKNQIKKISVCALFSALCIILYFYVKFPLPFFPSFLEINFSLLPAILGTYMLGPFYGSIIIIIRFLTKLGITHTAGVGEIADLIIGLSVVLSSSLIYKLNRTKKGAIMSLLFSSLIWVIVASLLNKYLLVPSYIKLYFKGNLDTFITMLKVIPNVNKDNYMEKYIFLAVIPFNLLLAFIVSTITFFTYKPLQRIINDSFEDENRINKKQEDFAVINSINNNEIEIVLHIHQ